MPYDLPALVDRRDFLRVGAVGLAGTLLPRAHAESTERPAKSVIVLWMAGGMTHHESFDPKPDAPAEIRGSRSAIRTTLPGVHFGDVMPNLAGMAHKLAVVRGFSSGNDDHFLSQAYALSGKPAATMSRIFEEPNVGSVVSKVLGPRDGLPGYLAVPGTTRPGPPPTNLFTAGWLGREHAPFATGGKARNEDFTAAVSEAPEEDFARQAVEPATGLGDGRLDERRALRERLDQGLRGLESTGLGETLNRQYRGAFEMLLAPSVRRAFDLRAEPDAIRERYGRTKIGQRCLLSRRLVEAGARFVLVDYGYDPDYGNLWDNHNAPVQKHPPICEMVKLPYHLAGCDRAFAALLADLDARGRLDETLVLLLTEFGRTPKINSNGGRDHWGTAGSLFLAGGGVRVGQVVGGTDKIGAHPTGARITHADIAATVYHLLGIDVHTTLNDRLNRPIAILHAGRPIPAMV